VPPPAADGDEGSDTIDADSTVPMPARYVLRGTSGAGVGAATGAGVAVGGSVGATLLSLGGAMEHAESAANRHSADGAGRNFMSRSLQLAVCLQGTSKPRTSSSSPQKR
jgi:hypothetical protein